MQEDSWLRRNICVEFQKMGEGYFVEKEVQIWCVKVGSLFQSSGIQEMGGIQGI